MDRIIGQVLRYPLDSSKPVQERRHIEALERHVRNRQLQRLSKRLA